MRTRHHSIPLSAATQGYLDGLTDARNDQTPFNCQTVYNFPRLGTDQEQRDYNAGYYEAKAAYANASELNRQWIAKQDAKGWIEL